MADARRVVQRAGLPAHREELGEALEAREAREGLERRQPAGNRLEKGADGRYRLTLVEPERGVRLILDLTLAGPIVRHGDDGVVRGVGAEEMFYYFCPRCEVVGSLEMGETRAVAGPGWYDHEFGHVPAHRSEQEVNARVGWNWIALQLDSGWQVTAYDLFDLRAGEDSVGHWAIAVDPAGHRHAITDFELTPTEWWTSTRTFARWPVRWRLCIPTLGLEVDAVAPVPAQEFQTLLAAPAFWEGIGIIRECGALHGSKEAALALLEIAWLALAPHIEDTDSKVRLRAFSWFLLDRHY